MLTKLLFNRSLLFIIPHFNAIFNVAHNKFHSKVNNNGQDPSAFFTFTPDFRPLRANHCFKLESASATLNSFKYSFFICVIDTWNNLPKEIAKVNNLNIFKNGLKHYLMSVLREH